MSTWRVGDYEATAAVVQTAIQRMGATTPTTISTAQIDHVIAYLTEQNWLATAADLRLALHNATQWTALDIPVRLKLALEEILQEWDPPQDGQADHVDQTQVSAPYDESFGQPAPVELPSAEGYATPSPVESTDGSWRCIRCTYQNQYQDSFCIVCYEHYSVSVVLEAPVPPSAPDFDTIVCAMPVAEEIPPTPPSSTGDVPPYPSLAGLSRPPPPPPLAILAVKDVAPTIPVSDEDAMSEHFKALAFNKPPSPKSKPSSKLGDVHSQRGAEPV